MARASALSYPPDGREDRDLPSPLEDERDVRRGDRVTAGRE